MERREREKGEEEDEEEAVRKREREITKNVGGGDAKRRHELRDEQNQTDTD